MLEPDKIELPCPLHIVPVKDGRVVAVGARTVVSTPGLIIYRLWP